MKRKLEHSTYIDSSLSTPAFSLVHPREESCAVVSFDQSVTNRVPVAVNPQLSRDSSPSSGWLHYVFVRTSSGAEFPRGRSDPAESPQCGLAGVFTVVRLLFGKLHKHREIWLIAVFTQFPCLLLKEDFFFRIRIVNTVRNNLGVEVNLCGSSGCFGDPEVSPDETRGSV